MNEVIDKINQVLVKLGGLDARFDSVEKKVDVIEDEIRCLRMDASKNAERIIRLEESYKNLSKDIDRSNGRSEIELKRIEKKGSDDIKALQENLNDKMDKKLLALKLAIYTALASAAFSIMQFALSFWRGFK